MPRQKRLVTEAQQSFTFARRALLLRGFQLGVGGILAGRMAWLAIAENAKYRDLAEGNRLNLTLIPPRRGWIVDHKGIPLALNRTAYRVDIIPDKLADKDGTLAALQQILALPPDEIERIRTELKRAAGFQPVQVVGDLDWEHFAAVTVRASELAGVAPAQSFARFYPEGAAVGHLLGYVGAASAKQYEETKDPLLVTPGFKVGKDGLERTLEGALRGKAGAKRTEVTARGKLVRELDSLPDTPGKTVRLTIDAGLQAYAARRLGIESGSVVVIDCVTGGIRAMASMPCYDPNSFSDGIGRNEWKMLREDDHVPLLNKTLQGLYPPGSTLKPMAAVALQLAGVDPDDIVSCGGGYRLGNRFFRCLGRHGPVNMATAIMKSCNTYFYAMGNRVGYDKIAPIARMMGLGQEFDLPVPTQRYGTVPDSAWKMRKYGKEWSRSDTLNATIGQGYVLASPLQLAVMAARIASGRNIQPRLLDVAHKPDPMLPVPPEFLALARHGMDLVVNSAGTGARSRLPLDGITMGGKTGTAQVRAIKGAQRGKGGDWRYRDHGLFVCFAPVAAPRYAAAVVIEHGMGGARAAAPVAKDVLTYIYDPAKAMAALEALEAGWGGDIRTRMARKAAAWNAANDPAAAARAAEEATAAEDAANRSATNNSAAEADTTDTRRTETGSTPAPHSGTQPATSPAQTPAAAPSPAPAPAAGPATGAPPATPGTGVQPQ